MIDYNYRHGDSNYNFYVLLLELLILYIVRSTKNLDDLATDCALKLIKNSQINSGYIGTKNIHLQYYSACFHLSW